MSFIYFLKNTKVITRVLVGVWLFFGAAGAGFDASQFIFTYPVMALVVLTPAVIVEYRKNPIWIAAREKSQIKKLEVENKLIQERKETLLHIKKLTEANERLKETMNEEVYGFVQDDDISLIDGMDGHDFEYFCAELLAKNGFYDVCVTKASGDQGVDILASKDGVRYAVQCKNYSSTLGNTPIQEVNAGKIFYNCHVGAVITNSSFTASAVELAKATGVLLWDRSYVQNMMRNK